MEQEEEEVGGSGGCLSVRPSVLHAGESSCDYQPPPLRPKGRCFSSFSAGWLAGRVEGGRDYVSVGCRVDLAQST